MPKTDRNNLKISARSPHGGKRSGNAVIWLIVLLAAVGSVLTYRAILGKVDRELHSAVVKQLQEMFPSAAIYLGHVSTDKAGEIVANDLRIAIKSGSKRRQIVSCERILLSGDIDIAHWVQQTIKIEQIDLFGLQMDVWPQGTGWSLQQLQPQNQSANPTCITIHDAALKIYRDGSREAAFVTLHDINGQITPAAGSKRKLLKISARSSGLVEQINVNGWMDSEASGWAIDGSLQKLDFSPALINQLPPQFAEYLKQLAGFECQATADFKIASQGGKTPEFEVLGKIASGRLRDLRLPYPLEDLNSDFYCDNSMLKLRSMTARSGGATLRLDTNIAGFRLDSPMVIHADATGLELDQRLFASLPKNWQEYWNRLRLEGVIDANLHLEFDGKTWKPTANIQCRDVSLTPWLFPYPLTRVQGQVTFQERMLRSESLRGLAGGQAVSGQFALHETNGQWFGKLNFATNGAVAIDEQLISALTPRDTLVTPTELFIRSLSPAGSLQLTEATFERRADDGGLWHRKIDLSIYSATMRYEAFPYPIYDIRGRIVAIDNECWLDQFEGRNDSGRILCTGRWLAVRSGQVPMDLKFRALALPVEEELQQALPQQAQYIWDQLQPSGNVDSVEVHISRLASDQPLSLQVDLVEDSHANEDSGRSLRLHPREFPYWLTDVSCNVSYTPGLVQIKSASAVNGLSRLSLEGQCRIDPLTQRWIASLNWLPSSRLMIDRQFLSALPENVRQSLVTLDLRGPVSVLGKSEFVLATTEKERFETRWNCQLDIEDGQLGDGSGIDAMRGTVWAQGENDGKQLRASGRVAMDALTVRGVPVTRLSGPFVLSGSQLFFGSEIKEAPGLANENIDAVENAMTAEALAGKLSLSGFGKLDSGKFLINANLVGAELTGLLQEVGVTNATTEARCDAEIEFNGIPWNPQTYSGQGKIHLSDAKLYQMPFMIRLLSLTSVTSDDAAFDTAEIGFELDGDRIPLTVMCTGDVLRLEGGGATNLRRELELELYAYIGRHRPIRDIVEPLLADSKYAAAMIIEVHGTLDNPDMQRRPFPQLDRVFPDRANRDPILPWRR